MRRKRFWMSLLVSFVLLFLFVPVVFGKAASPISVFVSVLPQKYFVERIGQQYVEVDVLVGPGESPATYDPTPKQMAALSEAKVYFRIGVPFEEVWMNKLQSLNPDMLIVDTREGVELRDIEAHVHEPGDDHGHHDHELHDHGEKDPHIWLDPNLVKIQAENIFAALVEIDPEHYKEYAANLAEFHRDLDAVDKEIRSMLSTLRTRTLMVFHPSWGYFADAYGLKQIPIELGGKEPSAKEMAQLVELAKREKVKVIIVQSQFSTKAAAAVARAVGAEVVTLDPLSDDYLNNLRQIARTIQLWLSN